MAACLLVVGGAYGYVRYRINAIRTVAAPHLTPESGTVVLPGGRRVSVSTDGLAPENILLIGNETRAGLTNPNEIAQLGSPQEFSGSLSDVIMILHLDPAKDQASILSIPRDLFLPMPAGSPVGPYQKVDAALNDGAKGADNLIQTITDDLGIPINHYVELEFDGFENTVNALGGINVYFPEPLYDAESLLDIGSPGCVHLNGTEALALVRARHLQYDPPGDGEPKADWPYDPESDLSRITRDHTFLRILTSTAESEGLTNPLQLNAFLSDITDQITIDPGLKDQLVALALHYHRLNSASIPEVTLPVTQVGGPAGYSYDGVNVGDVDFPDQPADDQVIAAWDHDALPAPSAPAAVQVDNITETPGLAGATAAALHADGLTVSGIGDGNDPAPTSETFVRYPPGGLPAALDVLGHLSGAVMLDPDPSLAAGHIELDVGSTLAVAAAKGGASAPSATASPPAESNSSTTGPVPGSGAPGTGTPGVTSTTVPTTVPTPGGQTPSSATDKLQPWDPRACPS